MFLSFADSVFCGNHPDGATAAAYLTPAMLCFTA
jgi:hypothetical protein